MTVIYIDWNVFNKLEKIDTLSTEEQKIYRDVEQRILQGEIIAPYSNAHINDLYRGYIKDPSYTPGHLENVTRLSKNLCMAQYWGDNAVKWHKRDPGDFLEQIKTDHPPTSYRALMRVDDNPMVNLLVDVTNAHLENELLPERFNDLYKADPIFNSIFPRSKISPNMLSLCEDLLAFSSAIKTDFALYKNFRKYLVQAQIKVPQLARQVRPILNGIETPKYLTWDEAWEEMTPKYKPSTNPSYDRFINLFTTTDLKGYRPDERFANLIDDALHAYYASYCQYFLTLDIRCTDKAIKVYRELNIQTVVLSKGEFNMIK